MRPHRPHLAALGLLTISISAPALLADDPPTPIEPSVEVPVMIDSGPLKGSLGRLEPEVVYETIVHAPGAPWVRVAFAPAPLTMLGGDPAASNAARLRLTSLHDGAVQWLSAEHLSQWSYTSAYFNGDAVRVELLAAGDTGPSRVVILSAIAGVSDSPVDRTICNTVDDRVLSDDPRAGRLQSVGCTAWLFNDLNSTFLTAGHCTITATSVVQFNVPLSTSGGTAQNPPPEDQYAVDLVSNQGLSGGAGNDWRYFACYPNSNTGLTPYQAQQARYTLALAAPTTDTRPIRITGYGTVSGTVSRTWNKVQKTHLGSYYSLSGSLIRYRVDTTGGNSGSAVLDDDNDLVIGIHTHGGCSTTSTSSNQGTAVQHSGLQAALAAPRGVCASGLGVPTGWLYAAGDLNNNIGTLDTMTGNYARVSQIEPSTQGCAFDSISGQIWVTDSTGNLWPIDPTTGATGQPRRMIGVSGVVNGLGFEPATATLLGIMQANGQLVRIDPNNGNMAELGPPRGGNIGALDYDAAERVLYGIDDAPGGSLLVRIDATDGAQTVIGPLGSGITDCNGLAWSPADGNLYTLNAGTEYLLRVNKQTGAATAIGPSGGQFGAAYGLAASPRRMVVCRADLDGDGAATVQDLLTYIGAWSSASPEAERDGTSGVTQADLFGFIAEWFAGCR